MLAFDLETTGLDPHTDKITCAAVYDPDAGIDRAFLLGRGEDPVEFLALLDAADRLCAFNGARFDLAFLRHSLGVPAERVRSWRVKLHDVYEGCRLALCLTFPLDALLAANGMEGKTGSGKEAVAMAQEGRWDELAAYCSHDTRMTHRVSSLDRIVLPKTRGLCMTSKGEFLALE
jgi:hypothetical protein